MIHVTTDQTLAATPSFPNRQRPSEQWPASADSCTQPAKKKVRPGTLQEPVLKSKKEMICELREKILEHQVQQLQGEERKIVQKSLELKVELPVPKLNEVVNIVPLSDKMKEWLLKQWEVYKAKNGQVESRPDDS
jgi:hypothetical protein